MDSPIQTASPSSEPMKKLQLTPDPPAKSPEAASESGERRPSRLGSRPPEPELLPCPRCDSTNTKFCYYNNYNLSQPRHFCKSCRRYWTRGGTLRNVPVGGGTRKPPSSNKRPRIATVENPAHTTLPPSAASSGSNSVVSCSNAQAVDTVVSDSVPGLGPGSAEAKSGNLSCWWSCGQMGLGGGLFPFNGYGLGLLPGLDYGNGLLDWSAEQTGVRVDGCAAAVSGESPGCGTWVGDGGVAEGDYFSWPELAISTPAKALK